MFSCSHFSWFSCWRSDRKSRSPVPKNEGQKDDFERSPLRGRRRGNHALEARDLKCEEISFHKVWEYLVNLGNFDEWKSGKIAAAGKLLAIRCKIRSRIISSESTRKCSNGPLENSWAGGATSKHTRDEREYSNSKCTRELVLGVSNKKLGIHEPSIHGPRFFQFLAKRSWECPASGRNFHDAKHTKTSVLIWRDCSCPSSDESRHPILGPNYLTNSEIYKKHKIRGDRKLVSMFTQKLVMEHSEEILIVKMAGIFITVPSDEIQCLSHDQNGFDVQRQKCETDERTAKKRWKDGEGQVEGTQVVSRLTKKAVGIDGEAIWIRVEKISQNFSSLSILQEIQKGLGEKKNIEPRRVLGTGSSLCQCSMDIDWSNRKEWWGPCSFECRESQELGRWNSRKGHWDVSGSWVRKKKWYGKFLLTLTKENGIF